MRERFDRWLDARRRLSRQYDVINEVKWKLNYWRDFNDPNSAEEAIRLIRDNM